ncbi:MAG: aminotransferase class I/II-fold pyridoxal phosphate-dependent enzyme [Proteobacteria bacterium]|nr:aminotransferase class I/II-fold pyridoxal phosphate-dependent enzyme [Pseudomonadota bacterium]
MKIKAANRITSLPEYTFKLIDDRVAELKSKGITPIDFGVGDPTTPTPEAIRKTCKEAVDARAGAGYPSYIGALEYREAVAKWTAGRFGIGIDPATEITSTIGSKEGVFNFHEAFVDPGDLVLIPSPGYPPYSLGTWFAEGKPWFYPLDEKNNFLPDLDAIPDEVVRKASVIWVNYPNSPTGVCPDIKFFERLYAWAKDRGIILASDEAYSEFYFGEEPPPTALQAGREGVVVFNSLSKRSAMTCYRIGWAAGDSRIIDILRKMKTTIDSGTPTFIQDAAVTALADENHVAEMRAMYRKKRNIMIEGLTAAGLERCSPDGTIYIWQKAPDNMTSIEFATRLTDPKIAIVTIPGAMIAEPVESGRNPGEGYVRFALTPSLEEVEVAANRLAKLTL